MFIDLLLIERILHLYNPHEFSHQQYIRNDHKQNLLVGCKIHILFWHTIFLNRMIYKVRWSYYALQETRCAIPIRILAMHFLVI
jgi:hypothetical protein